MADDTTTTEKQAQETAETLEALSGAPVPEATSAKAEEHHEEQPPTDPEQRKTWDKDQQRRQQEAANSEKKKLADRLARLEEAAAAKDAQIDRLLSIVEKSQQSPAAKEKQRTELDQIQSDFDLADKVRRGEIPEGEIRTPEEIEAQASRKMLAYQRKREEEQTQSQRQNEERQKALEAAKASERKGWEEFSKVNPDVPLKKAIALRDEIWSDLDDNPAVTSARETGGEAAAVAVKKALLNGQWNDRLAELKKSARNPQRQNRSPSSAPEGTELGEPGGAHREPEQLQDVGNRMSKFLNF